MSAKKGFETKIPEAENADSGCLSEYCSGPLSEEIEVEKSNIKVGETVEQLDSGIVSCELTLSEDLENVRLDDTPTATTRPPTITVHPDIPPLAILFQQDDDGDTQLHIAAVHGCKDSVNILIRVCPDRTLLDTPNAYGHTALHLAVLSGHALVARMLVLAGADVGARDLAGETPLHLATAASHIDCILALLKPLSDKQQTRLTAILNQKNYEGQTCVHIAAASGHIKTLQTIVSYGADINAREGLAGWTALHIAAGRGDARLAHYLLEKCPGVAVSARDYAGRTPRRYAARSRLAALFAAHAHTDSDSETDSDDDMYDSDSESLFDRIRESMNAINVA